MKYHKHTVTKTYCYCKDCESAYRASFKSLPPADEKGRCPDCKGKVDAQFGTCKCTREKATLDTNH